MIKWFAFFFAIIALCSSADESKVRAEFDRMKARLDAVERAQCTLMVVSTPSGTSTICATVAK